MLDEYSMNELFENNTSIDNTTNETITENTVQEEPIVTLNTIHQDLGFICTFLTIGAVVIFMIILYKFFNMFF